jgi:exodeoxyribonuclease V alpha subunit
MIVPAFFEELPRRFADFLQSRDPGAEESLWLAAALASQQSLSGASCVHLEDWAGKHWPTDTGVPVEQAPRAPDLGAWKQALETSTVVGRPQEFRPLILSRDGRLYLHRYWEYEDRIARALEDRLSSEVKVDLDRLVSAWQTLSSRMTMSSEQATAALAATMRRLTILSGGAGTGKTTIVAALLKLLASQIPPGESARIHLAAPTGKAAGRLKEQLLQYREQIDPERELEALLPDDPSTLHRLLGPLPKSKRFRHDASNPLDLHTLIVDEASMVETSLLARLVDALPDQTRLVLIGDHHQLPPVGVGSAFGDLCAGGPALSTEVEGAVARILGSRFTPPPSTESVPTIDSAVSMLSRSYRFQTDSGIGRLASAVRAAQADEVARITEASAGEDLTWVDLGAQASPEEQSAEALPLAAGGFDSFLDAVDQNDPPQALEALSHFRVLCAHRDGPRGVRTWTGAIEKLLRQHGRIKGPNQWYHGCPVIVTQNDYTQRLWNGDMGVTLVREGRAQVFFPGSSSGSEGPPGIRAFAPARLPHVEKAWALTVHKSQGSEFDRVLFVLPEGESRLLERELLYTGLTRARTALVLAGSRDAITKGTKQSRPRSSGLSAMLRKGEDELS